MEIEIGDRVKVTDRRCCGGHSPEALDLTVTDIIPLEVTESDFNYFVEDSCGVGFWECCKCISLIKKNGEE